MDGSLNNLPGRYHILMRTVPPWLLNMLTPWGWLRSLSMNPTIRWITYFHFSGGIWTYNLPITPVKDWFTRSKLPRLSRMWFLYNLRRIWMTHSLIIRLFSLFIVLLLYGDNMSQWMNNKQFLNLNLNLCFGKKSFHSLRVWAWIFEPRILLKRVTLFVQFSRISC